MTTNISDNVSKIDSEFNIIFTENKNLKDVKDIKNYKDIINLLNEIKTTVKSHPEDIHGTNEITNLENAINYYFSLLNDCIIKRNKNDYTGALLSFQNSKNTTQSIDRQSKAFMVTQAKLGYEIQQKLNKKFGKIIIISVILILLSIMLSLFIAYSISSAISKQIKRVTEVLNRTSNLNLIYDESFEQVLKYKDETGTMGKSLGVMRSSLREIFQSIKEQSNQVFSNSESLSNVMNDTTVSIKNIGEAANELSDGSLHLSRNLQVGAEKLDFLAKKITDTAESSELMKSYINETKQTSEIGFEYVNKLKVSVQSNIEVIEKISDRIEELENSSESIVKITDTIKSVTNQVNLLSLNATIEAARAGEHGKGFAVVANEIKKLASQTATSNKEIENIIKTVKSEIYNIGTEMDNVKTVILGTSTISLDTENAFKLISDAALNIINQVDMIMLNINNIDQDKNEVVDSIQLSSAISQQSVATTEQISISVQKESVNLLKVSEAAEGLKKIVEDLEALINKVSF